MSLALGTTCCILLWCFALSLVWAGLCFAWVAYGPPRGHSLVSVISAPAAVSLPALIVAPLTLLLTFRLAHINLLAPVQMFAGAVEMVAAAFVPAVVLLVASGLATSLASFVQREYRHWQGQACARLVASLGASVPKALARLVLRRALCLSWSQCLPWLYGELVVVEAVFNAPGLGLDAWHFARIRDHANLLAAVAWLAALYVISIGVSAYVHRALGRKLASYG